MSDMDGMGGVSRPKWVLPGAIEEERKEALAKWWRAQSEAEIEMVVAKAVAYGATDLEDIGYDLARAMNRGVSKEEATELGIYFYLRGKVSRWTAAVIEGRRVSDDTLLDTGIYVRMAQRLREAGGWPGV